MTEAEYIGAITDLWPRGPEPGGRALDLSGQAVEAFPFSPTLWCLRGDLIQVAVDRANAVADALACYRRAAELDPECGEAFESIGYIHYVYLEQYDRAEQAFRRAIALGAGVDSFAGLAKTLVEMGRAHDEAVRLLKESSCSASPEIRVLRGEITEGLWDPT